jgi:hypothetical protein
MGSAATRGGPQAWGLALGSLRASLPRLTLSGGGARRGSGTVRMRDVEEVQEATRIRTANSRVSEEGPTMRRRDSTRSCALAALPWSLASLSRHTAAALSPSRLRADRGLLERHRRSLRGRSKKPRPTPSRSGPTGRRGCVPEPRRPVLRVRGGTARLGRATPWLAGGLGEPRGGAPCKARERRAFLDDRGLVRGS